MKSILLLLATIVLSAVGCAGQSQYASLSYLSPTFPGLTSIAFDSTDFLYVLNGTDVVEFNKYRSVSWSIQLAHTLRNPVAIKVDTAGQLYVTDKLRHAVCLFTSEGERVAEWDGSKGVHSDGKRLDPVGLAFDRMGVLYVVDQSNQRVVEFDKYGNVTRYIDINGGSRQLLIDIVVDSLGTLYVSDPGQGRVVVLSGSNSSMVAEWFTAGDWPTGLAVDNSNLVYVGDVQSNTTFVFNTAGTILFRQKWSAYQLSPHWLAVDSSAELFVADVAHERVGIVTGVVLPGSILAVISGQSGPLALAVSNSSSLFIVDSKPSNIQYTSLSYYNNYFNLYQLTTVNASSTAANGLDVSNSANFACQTDSGPLLVNCYYVKGYQAGALALSIKLPNVIPGALAIDDVQQLIYVVALKYGSTNTYTIHAYSFSGQLINILDYGLINPTDIAVSPLNSNLVIADGNGRILVANRQSVLLHVYGGFNNPTAVAVDSSNNIYLIDCHKNPYANIAQLIVLDYRGVRLYTIEHGFNGARSVAVDSVGRIIVADTINNRIVMLQGLNTPIQDRQEEEEQQQQAAYEEIEEAELEAEQRKRDQQWAGVAALRPKK